MCVCVIHFHICNILFYFYIIYIFSDLLEQNDELHAMVLTRGLEEGRSLLNGTSNSLAQELDDMSHVQVNLIYFFKNLRFIQLIFFPYYYIFLEILEIILLFILKLVDASIQYSSENEN